MSACESERTDEDYAALFAAPFTDKRIGADQAGRPVLVDLPAALVTVDGLCSAIDAASDAARRAVAGDPLRAVEYDRAASEAQAFKDADYPADAVPRTVAAWAINGRSAQQAADSILAEAAAYTEALYQIRETRLSAKELVRQAIAAGNISNATSLTEKAITAIEQAVAGVGNSGG